METPANGFFRLNIASNNSQHYTSYFCCCVYFVLYAYLSNRTPRFVFTIGVYCVVLIGLQKVQCSKLHTLHSLEFIMYCICMTVINMICICLFVFCNN